MSQYGTGWIESVSSYSTGHVSKLFSAGALPSLGSDRRSLLEIRDQGQTSTCVGFALAQSIRTRRIAVARALALPVDPRWPSVLGIYTPARAFSRGLAGQSPSVRLEDAGCDPQMAYESVRLEGVPFEEDWPFDADPETVNAEPDVVELAGARAHLVTGFYDLPFLGDVPRFESELATALDQGYFPTFGQRIGTGFMAYQGGVMDGRDGLGPDGHMLGLCGHYAPPSGPRVFYGWNHWTPRWGEGGFFRCTALWLSQARDFGVITTTE